MQGTPGWAPTPRPHGSPPPPPHHPAPPPPARVPEEGPTFFVDLRIKDSDLAIVADKSVQLGTPQRSLLSVTVDAVDELLSRVEALGGTVLGPANDMPWGQRVAHIQDPDGNAVNLAQPI
ncbi:VOC family protein [Streptomyces lasiicapitis]|uniref:VOC family protein n=1 Tax=Streptomyces lasiicapitis TaxID=1923961 RepID=UPI00367F1210